MIAFVLDNLLPVIAFFVSGGVLFSGRFQTSKIMTGLLSLSAAIGFGFLIDDIKSLFRGEPTVAIAENPAVARLDAEAIGSQNQSLYIESDREFEVLLNFLQENSGQIVYLDVWFETKYLSERISNNLYGNDAEDIRYAACREAMSEFLFCDVIMFTNRDVFREYLDTGITGSTRITGTFAVREQAAPRNYINIPHDGMLAIRELRALAI